MDESNPLMNEIFTEAGIDLDDILQMRRLDDMEDMPLIHYCCWKNLFDAVKLCFEIGGDDLDVERADRYGDTLLHNACMEKNALELVRFLVETGRCDVEARNKQDSSTPLITACYFSDLDVVRYLVEHASANVHVEDDSERNPLHRACCGGPDKLVLYMAERSHVNAGVLEKVWRYNYSWDVKQALVETFARRELQLSENYVSKYPLHTALRTPLRDNEAYLEFVSRHRQDDDNDDHSVSVLDPKGQLPLHVALTLAPAAPLSLELLELEPRAAAVRDSVTGFYPFEAAALLQTTTESKDNDDGEDDDDDDHDDGGLCGCDSLELVYKLFRYDPGHFLTTRGLGFADRTANTEVTS